MFGSTPDKARFVLGMFLAGYEYSEALGWWTVDESTEVNVGMSI